jgi:hypothetical protein
MRCSDPAVVPKALHEAVAATHVEVCRTLREEVDASLWYWLCKREGPAGWHGEQRFKRRMKLVDNRGKVGVHMMPPNVLRFTCGRPARLSKPTFRSIAAEHRAAAKLGPTVPAKCKRVLGGGGALHRTRSRGGTEPNRGARAAAQCRASSDLGLTGRRPGRTGRGRLA